MSMRKTLLFFFIICWSLTGIAQSSPDRGQIASSDLIKQWSYDVFPDGEGLPEGQGNATQGEAIYSQHCETCHGLKGEGGSAEELAGAMHGLTDNPPDKTIGTYWPYATTLFDFIRRSMPLSAPGSLTNNQLYAVTAYLLYINRIIKSEDEISAKTLPRIIMPNNKGFIDVYEGQSH
ncbi:MAG: cytochrome c [Methylicorpusculum sp.]|uniref:c-type cytochrome n=1 Tax=Methylicorpusculum sp. TaxID=2713644 RepID=UPI0027164C2C|nr:cytochrome c [Methylicorpusculum sp.]MDO8846154.1 cytochrome c [Methylicorpusculum sp.]MDO8940344.1 cytochrome c [Methylicorpusculum sp.]MDO9239116.1 cytochrome c [Methylicorpusculum sp.]MDP2203801.1 cytochrome c [Methylicorpusculum sp.]